MQKTTTFFTDISMKILIDTNELQSLLSCGRYSAVKIGMDAEARVEVGRRVLWNRKKIEKYVNDITV